MAKQAQVTIKYLRISPKKIIPWLPNFRGKSIKEATSLVKVIDNKSAGLISKTISAGVSAAADKEMDEDNLIIKEFVCQTGPTMKRQLIRSRGRADVISKRSSNLKLVLVEKESKKGKKNGKKS
jgi:large subunit ribosomal protein L22